MSIFRFLKIISLLALITFLVGCGSTTPIFIKPAIQNFPTVEVSQFIDEKVFIGDIIDKRGVSDSLNIGFTQTGLWNIQTSILAKPAPTIILRDEYQNLLQKMGIFSTDSSNATSILKIDLSQFQITEVTTAFSEHIEATVQYDVIIYDRLSGKKLKRISASGKFKKGGFDTTAYAEECSIKALEIALSSFYKQFTGNTEKE